VRAQAEAAGASRGDAPAARDVFPLVPIGTLQSVFCQRNGTPRQARARAECTHAARRACS
jgi:hypothetical protein